MILACPSCRTRYVVPDSAIGLDGRKVRCAQCRFSWFQEGPEDVAAVAPTPPAQRSPPPPPPAQAPEPEPVAKAVGAAEAIGWTPAYEEIEEAPRRARRNPARLWTWVAVVAALLMVGALTALYFAGPQQLAAWMGGSAPAGGETLRFTRKDVAREPLPTDRDLLTVTGEITNVSGETQSLPQIRAEVTDASQNVIFTWMIAPPVSELQPGQAVTFSSVSTDVPKGGRNVNLMFRSGG